MSTQQDIYAAGLKNQPPMLNKDNYVPWSSCLLCYAKSKPNGKLLVNSIKNDPYNGLVVVLGITNQNETGNIVAARAEGTGNRNQARCYNCRGLGHIARNYTARPRRRDAAYLQTQLLIAQKEKAGIQLQVEEFDFMAAADGSAERGRIGSLENKCLYKLNDQRLENMFAGLEQKETECKRWIILREQSTIYSGVFVLLCGDYDLQTLCYGSVSRLRAGFWSCSFLCITDVVWCIGLFMPSLIACFGYGERVLDWGEGVVRVCRRSKTLSLMLLLQFLIMLMRGLVVRLPLSYCIDSKPVSLATFLKGEMIRKYVDFRQSLASSCNRDDVAISLESVRAYISKDEMNAMIENGRWGRSSYTRAMIELRADMELKDTIMVVVPKLVEVEAIDSGGDGCGGW
nr:Gag-Pol polyprotein [Tanacetum cinerariifolium]